MCFTVLLSSLIILHGTQLGVSAIKPLNNHGSSVDISLFVFKNGNERAIKGDEVRWSLDVLSANLKSVNKFNVCKNDTSGICLESSECPTEITLNMTEKQHDNTHQCFILVQPTDYSASEDANNSEKPLQSEVWGFGMLSVGIISLSGLFGGLFWPLMSSKYYDLVMRVLIGLAVGTLTATSAMQLIPQGFGLKETDVDLYLQTSVIMVCSIWSLYMFEISCKIFFHSENKPENNVEMSTHKLGAVNEDLLKQKTILEQEGLLPTIVTDSTNRKPSLKPYFSSHTSLNNITLANERRISLRKTSHSHIPHVQMGGMAPVAWMVILGDGLHNFVDGMSIGAGFSNSLATGLSISIAIACEEFPHELGDFAILINSGMPVKKALMYNFLSALTAVAGLILGILLGELEASTYIFAFAGGLFLYISLTDLMPELNNMIEEGLKTSKTTALLILLQQNIGIIFGYGLLYFISSHPVTVS